MANLVAVVTLDLNLVGSLNLFVGAASGPMANFIAVAALENIRGGSLACVPETLQVLGRRGRPSSRLARTRGSRVKAVRDGVLLTPIALEIHVGERILVLLFYGDEVNAHGLRSECRLKVEEGNIRQGFDIFLHRVLDILDLLFLDGRLDFFPGNLGSHSFDVVAIDLARGRALMSHVSYYASQLLKDL